MTSNGGDQPEDSAANPAQSLFHYALANAKSHAGRHEEAFGEIEFLCQVISGCLFNASQRLIDLKRVTGERVAADEAVILLCNRLFNEGFAGYLLLTHGVIGPAQATLRAALEVANLAVLMLTQPERAEPWLRGKRYEARDVRALLGTAEQAEWYGQLSKLTHANHAASLMSAYSVASDTQAIFYGGHYAPRATALGICAHLYLALTVLNVFYAANSQRLEAHGLPWKRGEQIATVEQGKSGEPLTWQLFLKMIEDMLTRVQEKFAGLPPDVEGIAEWAAQFLDHLSDDAGPRERRSDVRDGGDNS